MSEILITHLVDNPGKPEPMDRKEFYAEQVALFKAGKKSNRAAEMVTIFLFNNRGELLIQKRSFQKAHNAGLLDKSMGGHIRFGDSPDYTVMVETIQELQTPSIVLRSKEDFLKTLELLREYLGTIAIIEHLESKVYFLERVIANETIPIPYKVHAYIGVYDGRVRPADQEAKGILFYTLDELAAETQKFPDTFTSDLRMFLREYQSDMKAFLKVIKK